MPVSAIFYQPIAIRKDNATVTVHFRTNAGEIFQLSTDVPKLAFCTMPLQHNHMEEYLPCWFCNAFGSDTGEYHTCDALVTAFAKFRLLGRI